MEGEALYNALLADVNAGRLTVKNGIQKNVWHFIWSDGASRAAAMALSCRLKNLVRGRDGMPMTGTTNSWFDGVMVAALECKSASVSRRERYGR